ncbi:transposase [Streptomyces albidoflavus]|uniref:transposase n=1 Tax=Streptomyces albidoflavus TaxID=1886 RepID=UPI003404C8FA
MGTSYGRAVENRKDLNSAALARAVMVAAEVQCTALPGEELTARMVARLAERERALDEEITKLEDPIKSLPGMGTMLSAEFLAATGGDLDSSGIAGSLVGYTGRAPVPRGSRRSYRQLRYTHGLLRALSL